MRKVIRAIWIISFVLFALSVAIEDFIEFDIFPILAVFFIAVAIEVLMSFITSKSQPLIMCRAKISSKYKVSMPKTIDQLLCVKVILPNNKMVDLSIGRDSVSNALLLGSEEIYKSLNPGSVIDLEYRDSETLSSTIVEQANFREIDEARFAVSCTSLKKAMASSAYKVISANGKMTSKFSKKAANGGMLYCGSFSVKKGVLNKSYAVLLMLTLTDKQFNDTKVGDNVNIKFQEYKAISITKI